MAAGEYAVHYSSFEESATAPYCTVFDDLDAALAHARLQTTERPTLRCTIYDHHGMIGAPLRDIHGSKYKGDSGLSPRFRRYAGSVLFFGGIILIGVDWANDFRLTWPALVGTRMLIPGVILIVTEAAIVLHARLDRRRVAGGGTT